MSSAAEERRFRWEELDPFWAERESAHDAFVSGYANAQTELTLVLLAIYALLFMLVVALAVVHLSRRGKEAGPAHQACYIGILGAIGVILLVWFLYYFLLEEDEQADSRKDCVDAKSPFSCGIVKITFAIKRVFTFEWVNRGET